MQGQLRAKLLGGVAAVAMLSFVEVDGAAAQAGPYTWDFFIQGGYLFGDGGTNGLPYAEDRGSRSAFSIDPGDAWTGKVGAAAHFKGPWSGRLMYSGLVASGGNRTPDLFRGNANATARFPLATILPDGLRGTPHIGTSWNMAVVHTVLRGDTIDLQAGYDVGLGSVQGTVLAGLKYASVDQSTNVNVFDRNGVLEAVNSRKSSFSGAGPSLGGRASMPIVGHLSVEGGILGSLLLGQTNSSSPGHFATSTFPIVTRNFNSQHLAETVEGELALTYSLNLGPPTEFIDVSLGYQVAWYGGVRDTRNGASGGNSTFTANDGATFGSTTADLLFHGPFLRASWRW